MTAPPHPVSAACCSALFVLVVDLGHEGVAQQVVPLGAPLLQTADVSQADLGSRLQGGETEAES